MFRLVSIEFSLRFVSLLVSGPRSCFLFDVPADDLAAHAAMVLSNHNAKPRAACGASIDILHRLPRCRRVKVRHTKRVPETEQNETA